MLSLRRHRAPRSPLSTPPTDPVPGPIHISVSADLVEDLPGLATALGAGFVVVVDQPDACAVAVVGAVGPVGVAFLRMAHPRPALVVVDHGRPDARNAAACLDAGATLYVTRTLVAKVAGSIRSVARSATVVNVDVAPIAS